MSTPGGAVSDEELMGWLRSMGGPASAQPPEAPAQDAAPITSTLIPGVPDHIVQGALGFTRASETPQEAEPQATPTPQAGPPSEAPTLSQQFPHGQENVPASGPVTRPDVSPPPDATYDLPAVPTDPFRVPTYVRGQVERNERTEMDLARRRGELAGQEAEAGAQKAAEQYLTMQVAQKRAEDRVDRYQDLQDQTVQRLRSTSDAMLAAANDVSDLYPHGATPTAVVGNAALALAAGLGSRTAATMLEQAAEGDREWDRMAVERHNARLQGLGQAHSAVAQEFGALGSAGQETAAANASMQAARMNLFAKEMEALKAKFGPTQAGIDAGQAAADLRTKALGLIQSTADNQIKSYMMELQLGKMLHPAVGNPGEPPPEPVLNDEKHKGETEESFNTRYAQWKNVDFPLWKARQQAWLRGGMGGKGGLPQGTPAPSIGGGTASTASAPQAAKAAPAMFSPQNASGPVERSAPPSQEPEPGPTPAEREKNRRYSIPISGGDITLAKGRAPVLNDEQMVSLRNEAATADDSVAAVRALAALELGDETTAKDVIQRSPALGSLLKHSGVNVESVNKATADTVRHLLVARIASDVKERSRISQENFAGALPEEAMFGGNAPEKVKGSLGAVIDFMTGTTVSKLRASNYDPGVLEQSIEDSKSLIDGIGNKVRGPKQTAEEQGKAAAATKADEEWAQSVGGYSAVLRKGEATNELALPVHDNGKPNDYGAKNDAPSQFGKDYQGVGNAQLAVDLAARNYLTAMDSRDYTAAHKAFDQMTAAKQDQYTAARSILKSIEMPHGAGDPTAIRLRKRYGWDAGIANWTSPNRGLKDRDLDQFIQDMLTTDGKVLGDL